MGLKSLFKKECEKAFEKVFKDIARSARQVATGIRSQTPNPNPKPVPTPEPEVLELAHSPFHVSMVAPSGFGKTTPLKSIGLLGGMMASKQVFDSPVPLDISLVAPSGFGKTSLLATLMQEAQNKFADPKKGLEVVCGSQDDEERIKEANEALNNAILAGQAGYTKKVTPRLPGSADIKKFTFYLQQQVDGVTVRQPFSIMDIPGGWINPNNRISDEMKKKWEVFKERLRASRLLFVPIDATLIMEYGTDKEQVAAVKILDSGSTSDLIKEWAKYRKGSDKSSALIFVPIKCEKYREKAKELEMRVKQFYAYTAREVHDICSDIQQYYIPLETLGCVEFTHGKWETEEGKEEFQAEFRMAGDGIRRTKNVDQIFSMIASMAGEELQKIKNTLNWKVNGKNVRIILYILGIIAYILSRTKKIVSPEEIINALLSYKENSGVAARRITWWE